MENEPGLINGNSNQTSKWDTLSDVEFSSKSSPNSLNNPDNQWAYDIDIAAEQPEPISVSEKQPRPEILDAKHQRTIMESIPAPTDTPDGLENILSKLRADEYQSSILARMNRLGPDGGHLLKPRHLEDFVATFPLPSDFDDYSQILLEKVQQSDPQQAANYEQAMIDFKNKVYGPRQVYFDQMKAINQFFDDPAKPSTSTIDSFNSPEQAPDTTSFDTSNSTDTNSTIDSDGIVHIPGVIFSNKSNHSDESSNINPIYDPAPSPQSSDYVDPFERYSEPLSQSSDSNQPNQSDLNLNSSPVDFYPPQPSSTPEQHQIERSAEWEPGIAGVAQVSRAQVANHELSDLHNASKTCQDAYLVRDDEGVFGVFDGVGSTLKPREAAQIAAKTVSQACDEFDLISGENLAYILNTANSAIQDETNYNGQTTATIAKIIDSEDGSKKLAYAQVGDSRIYLVHADGSVEQITEDEGIENRIWNSLGSDQDDPTHQYGEVTITPGDRVVLCSDGITGDRGSDLMSNEELGSIVINARSPKEASERLVANARKTDDRTAVVFSI